MSNRQRQLRLLTDGDAGAGIFATINGFLVVLLLLLFATQTLIGLYAGSVVTAAAWDAARSVAAQPISLPGVAEASAEADARTQLGQLANRTEFQWNDDVDVIRLTVRTRKPSFLPAFLRRPLHLDHVDRTIRVQRELFR